MDSGHMLETELGKQEAPAGATSGNPGEAHESPIDCVSRNRLWVQIETSRITCTKLV